MSNSPTVQIEGFALSNYGPPFIIAEAGINHNGEFDKAIEMIKVAKKAGADAVKFQTFKAEEFCGDPGQKFTYVSQGVEVTESMLDMFKRHEFTRSQWLSIKRSCDSESILFLSTPQNRSDLDLLLELGIPAIKVGSDDFTNLPLLRDYASTNLPMIVSCGMSDFAEIYNALETIGALDGYPTVLLLCTSEYPTPPDNVNLLKLKTLAAAFPELVLGFSDHTQGNLASCLAVARGACCFEKHFTLDNGLPGPDHYFSADPEDLTSWVSSIRTSHRIMGGSILRPTEAELSMKTLARRSVVVLKDIGEGEALTTDNIGLRRPGNGLPPSWFDEALQCSASRSLKAGELLEIGDLRRSGL